MNSFNFLDNIDGLAAGTVAIAAGTLALTIFVAGGPRLQELLACAVAGAALGFLPLNYRRRRPAALFMGDSGSLFLGLTVGESALVTTPAGVVDVSAAVIGPLLILALPILDTSLVILVRLAEGRPIWRGGRDHLSHRLVYAGLGEREAVAVLLMFAAVCAGAGVLVVAADDALVTGAAAGAVLALLVGLGSRLALVTEGPRVALQPAFRERERQRQPDHAHAR
jgi:UDP-GlcNAc:undecaprenyl-phosphate GlcNAc-1-phosphate transferase